HPRPRRAVRALPARGAVRRGDWVRAEGARLKRRAHRRRLRRPGTDRVPPPQPFSDPVRGCVLPAADRRGGSARAGPQAARLRGADGGRWHGLNVTWYVVLSAFLFAIGAAGVL